MKKYRFFFGSIILVTFLSCTKHHDYIYSPDKKQCITIISDKRVRYIINGKHSSIPDSNYVKLDINNGQVGDDVVGCWNNGQYDWKLINDGAKIIENKLDTLRFKFGIKFPTNNKGIPTIIDFTGENCFEFGFEYNIINKHKRGIIVE